MPVAAAANLRPRVITTSGAPLPNAVVELISANPSAVPYVAVTDAKGVVASDRSFEPPGLLSLGPLAPGAYAIELYGAGGRRQERIRIVNRDVYATFR